MASRGGAAAVGSLCCWLTFLASLSPPGASGVQLELRILEEQPAGAPVGDLSAALPSGTVAHGFFISDSGDSGVNDAFHIAQLTGAIVTARPLDREARDRYSFVAVTLSGVTISVLIHVADVNDHAPRFPRADVGFNVSERTPRGTRLPLDAAVDADVGEFDVQGYEIRDGNAGGAFRLDASRAAAGNVELVVDGPLDRESVARYELLLEAFDGGIPPRRGALRVHVAVLDVNDNSPVFNQTRYDVAVSENTAPGTAILRVFATDKDDGPNGVVIYSINRRQSDPDEIFVIDAHAGVITLSQPLDFETKTVHELVIQARDNATQPEYDVAFVTINVEDYNDNQPSISIIFLSESGEAEISEGASPGDFVARISASDPDAADRAQVNVSMAGGDGKFGLTTKDTVVYLICVDQSLDREEKDAYSITVVATDSGSPPLRATANFSLQIRDVNDNAPVFEQAEYLASVPDSAPVGTPVLQVSAADRDSGVNADVRYALEASARGHPAAWFSVDPSSGWLRTAAPLDRAAHPRPRLTVVARDDGRPSLSASAAVTVTIEDAAGLHGLDAGPPVFSQVVYNTSLPVNARAGTCFLQVRASLPRGGGGGTGPVSFSLDGARGGPVPFRIDPPSGWICTTGALGPDAAPYLLAARAHDGAGHTSQSLVRVSLGSVTPRPPEFYPATYTVHVLRGSAAGTRVTAVVATDGSPGPLIYSIGSGNQDSLFRLEPSSGVISLARHAGDVPATVRALSVRARGAGGLSHAPANVSVSFVSPGRAAPLFSRERHTESVPEDARVGTSVGTARASSTAGRVRHTLSGGDPHGRFAVEPLSGTIRTRAPLDHETAPVATLAVTASSGEPPVYSTATVTVLVGDVNDNAPTFAAGRNDAVALPRGARVGSAVYTARATDADSGPNGQVRYRLRASAGGRFGVNSSTGSVTLLTSLSTEPGDVSRQVVVLAEDAGTPALTATLTLSVLMPGDRGGLAFEQETYHLAVGVNTAPNTRLLRLSARGDGGDSRVAYGLRDAGQAAGAAGGGGGVSVAPSDGWLYVRRSLEREAPGVRTLHALAWDPAAPSERTATATVSLTVTAARDGGSCAPGVGARRLHVPENRPAWTSLGGMPQAAGGQLARAQYRLSPAHDHFHIDAVTGELSTRMALDREEQDEYRLQVVVTRAGAEESVTVCVTVTDDNDNTPTFLTMATNPLELQVHPGADSGWTLGRLTALDPDAGENGTVVYSLAGPDAPWFRIHADSGVVSTAGWLGAERTRYSLVVTAADRGQPPLNSSMPLHVQVRATKGLVEAPESSVVELVAVEGTRPGTVIGSVCANASSGVGCKSDAEVLYRIVGGTDRWGTFGVDATTGHVYLARELDYEVSPTYQLQVAVETVTAAFTSPGRSLLLVSVSVTDVNEHAPRFAQEAPRISVQEGLPVGRAVHTFRATDADGSLPNRDVRYELALQTPGSPAAFALDPVSGVLSTAAALDREAVPAFLLVVRATDQAREPARRRASEVTALVTVGDDNDNAPVFLSANRSAVPENAPPGFPIMHVVARDADLAENGTVRYAIADGDKDGAFDLHPVTGLLSVARPLDRERRAEYTITVDARDGGRPQRSSSLLVTVALRDVNDEPPRFPQHEQAASVRENAAPNTPVTRLQATDPDAGANGALEFEIPEGVADGCFRIHRSSGQMSTTRSLDREERGEYDVPVLVRDGGRPARWAVTVVRVAVVDENDHAPRFGPHFAGMQLQVPENREPGPLLPLSAWDPDAGENGRVTFHIVGGDPRGDFLVHADEGLLSTARPLDREAVSSYELRLEARDRGEPARSHAIAVSVSVTDENDHAPAFPQPAYQASLPEDAPPGTSVLRAAAVDPDQGPNAALAYWLEGSAGGAFRVDERSGTVRTRSPLDREARDSYRFFVVAADSSPSHPRSASVAVTVTVRDVNDNAPVFLQELLEVGVPAASVDGEVLGRLQARDADYGPNAAVLYRVQDPRVTVDSRTGELRARPAWGGAPTSWDPIVVTATDQGSPPHSASALLLLTRQNAAHAALRFSRQLYAATLPEHTPRGTIVATVEAAYQDGSSGRIIYSIVPINNQNIFYIDSNTGAVRVQDAAALDYEASPRLRAVVSAKAEAGGGRGPQAFAVLEVTLTDVNDHEPVFQHDRYVAFVREQSGYGTDIATVLAKDRDDGSSRELVYSIPSVEHASIFQINRHGNISTNTILDHEITDFYRVVVWAVDQGSPPLTGSTTLSVFVVDTNDNTPTIPRPPKLSLREDVEPGSLVTLVTANDVDSYPALEYSLAAGAGGAPASGPHVAEGGGAGGPFGLVRWQGQLLLSRALDRERAARHTVSVLAWDGRHATVGNLTLHVTDVNDNAPAFDQPHYRASVVADSPEGTAVARVVALDPDAEENGRVSYRVASSSTAGFSVHQLNGSVVVTDPLQVNSSDGLAWLVVEARDGGRPPLTASVPVFVELSRGPVSPPLLRVHVARAHGLSVSEDAASGTVLTTLTAETAPRDGEGVAYSIVAGDEGGIFAVDTRRTSSTAAPDATGSLLLLGPLDFETKAFYNLTIVAFDGTGAHGNATVNAIVRVTDVNDNPPVFSTPEYHASVDEDLAVGTGVVRVAATDPDSQLSGGIHYGISSGNERSLFGIGESSGAISLLRPLDREQQEQHNLTVLAWDGAHAAIAVVSINVEDVNDNAPFFPAERLYASVLENEPAGSLVAVLRAVDRDTGPYGTLSYSTLNHSAESVASEGAGVFTLDPVTGELRTRVALDRESVSRYALGVRAQDLGGLSATVGVIVHVTGVDEFDPTFTEATYQFTVLENAQAGESVGVVSATDKDGGLDGIVLYYLKYPSVYFGINETTGHIYLKVNSRTGLHQRRFRRDAREVFLKILAKSPLPESRISIAVAVMDVTHTAIGIEREGSSIVLAVGLAVGFGAFAVVLIVLLVVLIRRKRQSGKGGGGKAGGSGRPSQMDMQLVEPADMYRTVLPHYSAVGPALMGPDFPDHSAHSHSSGRGSAEGDAAADDEIRMITENPARGPHGYHGPAGAHSTLRGPDSGIQHDTDHLSDVSHVTHLSSEMRGGGGLGANEVSGLRSPLASVADECDSGRRSDSIRNFILQTLQQAERAANHGGNREAGAASRVSRGSSEDGRPPVEGALTSIVASEEELRGSYDWDYLLNWSPRFQPLAGVFAEIGRLKDESLHSQQKSSALRARVQHKPHVLPPPLITSVVPPGTRAVAPRPVMSWTTIPRSPITHEPLSTSHAMSPSLTPSLSPLATRSPVVSPFVTSQTHGPTAVIFGNGQSPDGAGEDPEMHI
ncbi:protocadherin-16 [Petromyzon marinus]|uniref:Protocadherin-16 n=1 Tax=Petromyzon marinus TaxID=7757 RepID=A0AAJ7T8N8_PETMA|nr:protocadherin-16 [Petromyzon marinus]